MRTFRFLAPLMTLMLVLAACGNGDGGDGGNGDADCPEAPSDATEDQIIVTSLWGGAEQEAFEAVLAAFEEETGITATYEPNRTDYATVLRTRIQGGNPPDVAIIPGIGFLRSFARDGSIVPLDCYDISVGDIEGEFVPGTLDAGNVDDTQYAVMAKLNSKATIWYDPQRFGDYGVEPVETWDELVALTEDIAGQGGSPWSLAAADGWTLTDWFEATYLKMHGADAYRTLFSAEGDWTDGTAQETIEKMYGELLNADHVDGGTDGALATAFVDGIAKVFSTSPSAEMYCCGAFVGGIAASGDVNPDLTYGTDIDWFPFPTVDGGEGAVTDISYGGDVIAGLTNRPEVGEFLRFMTTVQAGTAWAEGGTIISPLSGVETSVYPESVQAEAEQIANATNAVFDGSDLLPAGPDLGALLQSAFRGDDAAALLEDFQSAVSSAWETE
ncbi:MAG TPA: extracellular solute-binding protein [Candidatus Angelobacter sp.]|nr:extracellular solute-binding protein [Candidatus Angelobacter sp.]